MGRVFLVAVLLGLGGLLGAAEEVTVTELVKKLSGDDALASHLASCALVRTGDAAVGALATLAASNGSFATRMTAVELLGEIATEKARLALVRLLESEKHLAVRGQLCIQLGRLRERRAVPVITRWLETIGPGAINDVPGPKEVQPSTCYARHCEALGMIGDENAVPALEAFEGRIPRNVGYGGFISSVIRTAAENAIEDIREENAFWKGVRKHPGLEQQVAPLVHHLHADPVSRFRYHAGEIFRGTAEGRRILERLSAHPDAAVARGAKTLLAKYGEILP